MLPVAMPFESPKVSMQNPLSFNFTFGNSAKSQGGSGGGGGLCYANTKSVGQSPFCFPSKIVSV